ncbi:MAG: hypothetical protein SF123_06420 [Chloroflexota bacterium]|nr:hypothetical protein [Chloroflexota bacterium]
MARDRWKRLARPLIGIAVIVLASLLCAATIIMPVFLSLTPMTRPAFLATNGSTPGSVCVQIDQAEFWRANDSAQSIQTQIESTTQFAVNGIPAPYDPRNFIHTLTLASKIDDQGNVVGSFSGPSQYCFPVPALVLPAIMRWASVSVTTSDGVNHYYAWILPQ